MNPYSDNTQQDIVPSLSPYLLYLACFIYIFCLFILARLSFCVWIYDKLATASLSDIVKAIYIGIRFDARCTALLTLPLILVLSIPYTRRRLYDYRIFLTSLYALLLLFVFSIYAIDAGFFAYLGERLNSKAIDLAYDTKEAIQMLWESYPLLKISFGVILITVLASLPLYWLFSHSIRRDKNKYISIAGISTLFLLFLFAIWGRIGSNFFPLRWSNAYFTTNAYITALALNPIQNVWDTSAFIDTKGFDIEKAKEVYPLVAELLNVDTPNKDTLNYHRYIQGDDDTTSKPNVIVIIMESLSYSKTSFASQEYDTTPYLNELAKTSLLFTNFFANARTTARGVFSTMTGIPDVSQTKTASRDQRLADQRVIANEFKGYQKFYLIGGSTAWANIRGVLGSNISGLRIFEESDWKASNVDVWGISDYDLFMEANEIFSAASEPFLAVIQTAGFHKPYTIPQGVPHFRKSILEKYVQDIYGFESEEEYNSLRFSDYSLGEFFIKAKQHPYYKNTIFVILGDHGVFSHGSNVNKSYTIPSLQAWHTPLLIHAPFLVQAGVRNEPVGQVDVFPTVASLAGISYNNYTLGRNILSVNNKDRGVLISGSKNEALRYLEGGYCFYDNKNGSSALYKLSDASGRDYKEEEPSIFEQMKSRAWALEITAKYMIFNNKKM